MIISQILNILHLILLFFPVTIYLIDLKYLKPWFKFAVLIALLTPLHWEFFDNQCVSTILTKKLGDFSDTRTTSAFSERYLKWLYKPLMDNLFRLKWNSEGLSKMVYIHWIVNFVLIWYFIFYKYH
jgi:hypothetical protein